MMPTSLERDARACARRSLLGYATEAYSLLTAASDVDAKVRHTLEAVEAMRTRLHRAFGADLRGLDMLEVAPDPQLGMLRCLARENEVTALDPDVRRASPARVVTSVVRMAAGFDRRFVLSLSDRLGKTTFAPSRVVRMDPARMQLDDGAFDLAYAGSRFASLPRPDAVLDEMRRVLAPGGIAYLRLRLPTSHAGQHDPRLVRADRPEPPYWPHLRAPFDAAIGSAPLLDRMRLPHLERMLEAAWPGVRFDHERQDRELAAALRKLRALGELTAYGDDELLTSHVVAMWKKPLSEA